MALDTWRVLRGRPALYIEDGKLVMRYLGGRRITLEQITSCTFEGVGSAYDPSAAILQLRDAKPLTLRFSPTLRPVSGFTDLIRHATHVGTQPAL